MWDFFFFFLNSKSLRAQAVVCDSFNRNVCLFLDGDYWSSQLRDRCFHRYLLRSHVIF